VQPQALIAFEQAFTASFGRAAKGCARDTVPAVINAPAAANATARLRHRFNFPMLCFCRRATIHMSDTLRSAKSEVPDVHAAPFLSQRA
jgi:hypothetical protein